MSKVVLLTGIGALLLGVVQNLPQPSVVEVDYPTQIEAEYRMMDEKLNSIPGTVDSHLCSLFVVVCCVTLCCVMMSGFGGFGGGWTSQGAQKSVKKGSGLWRG